MTQRLQLMAAGQGVAYDGAEEGRSDFESLKSYATCQLHS